MPSLEQINALLADDPDDVFLHYSRAMELSKQGRVDEAVEAFDHSLELDSTYCAAYYHKGRTLIDAGRHDEARAVLTAGQTAAETAGDAHTRDEITGLLDTIP